MSFPSRLILSNVSLQKEVLEGVEVSLSLTRPLWAWHGVGNPLRKKANGRMGRCHLSVRVTTIFTEGSRKGGNDQRCFEGIGGMKLSRMERGHL